MNFISTVGNAYLSRMAQLALAVSFIMISGSAVAGRPSDVTDAEMRVLPRYCPDTMGFSYGDAYTNTSPRASYWVSLMGKGFWAIHHYCWALINLGRAQKSGVPPQIRKGLWEAARADMGYVVSNTSADFVMLPEIFTRIGEVETLLGNANKANEAFARAREMKPDYWPAYSRWAEFLIKIGRRQDALNVVISGLEHAPSAKVLLEQFRFLGGKPSDLPKAAATSHNTENQPALPSGDGKDNVAPNREDQSAEEPAS